MCECEGKEDNDESEGGGGVVAVIRQWKHN